MHPSKPSVLAGQESIEILPFKTLAKAAGLKWCKYLMIKVQFLPFKDKAF
jgi:hypothetical protein